MGRSRGASEGGEEEVMERYMKALVAAIGLWLAAPATALAGPTIAVSVGLPRPVIVAPAPVAIYAPTFTFAAPGPDYIWVEGAYRYDGLGRLVWVPGHWRLGTTYVRPIVVSRPYAIPRPVVVKAHPIVVRHRDHDHRGRH